MMIRSTPAPGEHIPGGNPPDAAVEPVKDPALGAELAQSRVQLAELSARYEEVIQSPAYRIGSAISRSPLGTLYRAASRLRRQQQVPGSPVAGSPSATEVRADHASYSSGDFLARLQTLRQGEPVAIAHPEWLGIRSSASQVFEHLLFLRDDLSPPIAQEIARRLADCRPSAIVFQGFPYTYQHLVESLHRSAQHIPLYAVWHGTFMQASEDYAWRSFRLVCSLQRQGKIRRIGCVKRGQDEILRRNGLDASFLLNRYTQVPQHASQVADGASRLGIWSISELRHKPPYEMLAAASMIDNAIVVGSVASQRMREFCEEFGVPHDFVGSMVPQAEMPEHLAACHVNLYVTLNECAPMLPLESFAVGAPCIVGPNTPYFEDDPYLRSRLVVDVPDDASEIAARIGDVLRERDEIVSAYKAYAMRYNALSAATVRQFLD